MTLKWPFLGIDGSNKSAASKCLGLRDGKWKLFDTNPPLLYDLENDLSEEFDLYKSHTALADRMKQKLDKMVDQINKRNEKSQNGKLKKCWSDFLTAIFEIVFYFHGTHYLFSNTLSFQFGDLLSSAIKLASTCQSRDFFLEVSRGGQNLFLHSYISNESCLCL